MSDSFTQAFNILRDFIKDNPEIEFRESVSSVPENVRPEFYRRFNSVRKAFVAERFPALLDRAQMLQENYAKTEKDLAYLISWDESPEVNRVHRFLGNVSDSMTRELFDPLFDLLKGRQTLEGFEQQCTDRIQNAWPEDFRGGYEKWVVLSLVRLLEPETALRVDIRALKHGERAKSAEYAPWDDVPPPKESSRFFFSQPRNAILAVPDLIVRSKKLNRFVGIRSEFREGLYKALNPSQKREWSPMDSELLSLLASGLTLIYIADEEAQIALVADASRFCQPDMILWCVDSHGLDETGIIHKLSLIEKRVRPRIGSFAVLAGPLPESGGTAEEWNRPDSRIRLLNTGFDALRLQEVVTALLCVDGPELT